MKAWRVTAASVRGASHIKAELPCQDASHFLLPNPGLLLAAVADGAGSASESQRGASLACQAALDFLKSKAASLTPESAAEFLRQAVQTARERLLAEAASMQLPPREMACTLILLAASREWAAAAQLGDGAALLSGETGSMSALTTPPPSEYLNETTFLTSPEAPEHIQTQTVREVISGVAIVTDGLQMLALKMPDGTPHEPFFKPLFNFIQNEPDDAARSSQFEQFLTSPRITQRADDDLTLLLGLLM